VVPSSEFADALIMGDREAFAARCEPHRAALGNLAGSFGFTSDDADDLAQEAIVRAAAEGALSRLATPSVRAFLFGVLKNVAREAIRKRARETPFSQLPQGDDAEAAWDRRPPVFPPAPEPALPREGHEELLKVTFATDSPPHQLLAFFLCKVTSRQDAAAPPGEAEDQLAQGKPARARRESGRAEVQRVVERWSDTRFSPLEPVVEQSYVARSRLSVEYVRCCFRPLRASLPRRFGEVVQDPTTRGLYPDLLSRVVGETAFRDYYRDDDPAGAVTSWWYAVQRRVWSKIAKKKGPLAAMLRQEKRRRAAEKAERAAVKEKPKKKAPRAARKAGGSRTMTQGEHSDGR